MKVRHGFGPRGPDEPPTVVAVGTFAIVHRGHEVLLGRARDEAGRLGAVPAVVTFDHHPIETLRPELALCRLATLEQRCELLDAAGIVETLVIPFTEEVGFMTPEAFVRAAVLDGLRAAKVVVGEDFRFGHDRAGDVSTLQDLGSRWGFEAESVALVLGNGRKISSSDIRRMIGIGAVDEAAELIGRPYRLAGRVVHGDKRGRELGFPTANLGSDERACLPALGVYAARWRWRGRTIDGVVNVGVRPTFDDPATVKRPVVEIHIFDFAEDLYGQPGEIEFVARIRDEIRFESVDALVDRMHDDASRARRILVGHRR